MQRAYNRNKQLKAKRKVNFKKEHVLKVRKYLSRQHGFQLNIAAVREHWKLKVLERNGNPLIENRFIYDEKYDNLVEKPKTFSIVVYKLYQTNLRTTQLIKRYINICTDEIVADTVFCIGTVL